MNNNQNTQSQNQKNKSNNIQASGMKSDMKSDLQETIMKQIHDLGDSIERAGEKVENAGWEKIGQAIYSLGNKLEHLNEGFSKNAKSDVSDVKSAGATKTNDFSKDSSFSKDNNFSKDSSSTTGSTTDTQNKTTGNRSTY